MRQESVITFQPTSIPQQTLYLLMVDDVMADIELITITLEAAGVSFLYDIADTAITCRQLLQAQAYDAVLSDYRLPSLNGLQVLKLLQESGQDIPLILVTGTLGEEAAVECIKAGMNDYVLKERLFRLPSVLARALDEFELRRQRQTALAQLQASAWRDGAINRIVQTMRQTLVLDEVLQTTVDQLHGVLQVSRSLILQPQQNLEVKVSYVSKDTVEGKNLIGFTCSFAANYKEKLERGSAVVIDRICANVPVELAELAQKYSVKAAMMVPLVYQQEYLGAISLHQCDRDREWTADELALVIAIADQCAIAIHQAKLFQQAQTELAERQRMEVALRQAEAKYRGIFENAVEGIYQIAPDGRFLSANPALARIYGYNSPETLVALTKNVWAQLYVDPYHQADFITAMREQGGVYRFESQVYRADGNVVWIAENTRAVYDETGTLLYYEGSVEDITEHKQTESLLMCQKRMLEMLVTDVPLSKVLKVLCWMVEAHSDGVKCNILLKDEAGEWELATEERDFTVSYERSSSYTCLSNPIISEKGQVLGTFTTCTSQNRSPTFRERKVMEIATRLAGIAIERRHIEAQLRHDAFHDSLTGLYNRAWFIKQLQQILQPVESQRHDDFAVIFLDLDNFKVINDSLGHLVGDQLLLAIASRLQKYLRANDTVARLGGDEFAILLEKVPDIESVCNLAAQLQQALKMPLKIDTIEIFTTVSIGITFSATSYERPEELLRDADIALYRAKQQGKDRFVVFDRTMHQQAIARLHLETDLRQAIERNELLLHYQPIVSLASGKIVGFEALVRWQQPERGLVSPAEFIPIAEETGLIIPLGWWVLRAACQQLQEWQIQFPDYPRLQMSVNLSGKQFAQANLVEQLERILVQTGCSPENLKLEITESTLMEGGESAVKMLEQLQQLGIQLCIDDFGTGYSSLSRLHQLPINTLKIDRTFVKRMGAKDENTEIVRSIVSLGHSLGMDIVAEGIELSEQLAQLRKLQCDYGQGYFFAKPLDTQAATKLIESSPQW